MGTKELQKKAKYKWKFAIGTSSRVPNQELGHYLMLDIDNKTSYPQLATLAYYLKLIGKTLRMQETKNGIHVYTNLIESFDETAITALSFGADPNWIKIAKTRGYFFLADKDELVLSWPVERMILSAQKGTKINPNRT